LERNEKVKVNGGLPTDKMPRLLTWAGRNVNAVNVIFDHILSKPIDDEFLALLQCAQIESSVATLTRGFAIFKSDENRSTVCIDRQVKELEKANRPIVFVYSGVGSQWIEMGRDLMRIPLIAESIEKCHNILLTKGINLQEILTSKCPNTFKSCLSIFVGVVSIQIALTDLLIKLGVKPNFLIGHSVGELGCAYADGTLTLEQTILTAYSRGMSIIEGVKEIGMMAAVAMSYEELKNVLPKDIEIACHNSEESCTISGPCESVQKFVTQIKSQKVLAKIVDSSGVAFHSSLIANCGSIFESKLREIIIDPRKRSSKWISTSMTTEQDEFSSIAYHVNNMLKPVRFSEGLSKLPEDSLLIEIAPHGLLVPILKQSIKNGISFSLTQRGIEDGEIFLLQSLGKIYQSGVDMDIRQIYPKIEFPVSRGTAMISPLVRWLHDESFPVPMYDPFLRCDKRNLTININDPLYSIMKGHQIDGNFVH
jgi:fatty acid synthase, animal type